ncbi:MAG: cell division protein FtsZ, partial [Candidatus Methylomirabilis sp.]|nr:cell division protein FtsZ [Deltaproteobacteria bacterium]
MLMLDEATMSAAKIKVVGVGGAGGNALNSMLEEGVHGVDFIAANSDFQVLNDNRSPFKLQLGESVTHGLGAGGDPRVGQETAEASAEEIRDALDGADMVFLAAGMGGGTGTGAAPVIARIAKELGALTVAVVTKPFLFEGKRRKDQADQGIADLRRTVDTLITIPNHRLLDLGDRNLSWKEALRRADATLVNAVRGITDLIHTPGLVNLDFKDVQTIMSEGGMALMGTGSARGDNRAVEAAKLAIRSPLLEDIDIKGATAVLLNIAGGDDLTLFDVNEAATLIHDEAHEDVHVIFGTVCDPSLRDEVRVTVIATGFDRKIAREIEPAEA